MDDRPEVTEVELGEPGVVSTVTQDDVDVSAAKINDFLDAVQAKNYTSAGNQFNDMINDRLQDTLDQARVRIAGQMFNNETPEDETEIDDEVETEDEEDAVEN